MFTCVSCHLRSGLGSYEGSILATATNGEKLYKPYFNVHQETPSKQGAMPWALRSSYQAPPLRPAYTDETLAVALRTGVDPTGRKLDSVMPRYLLKDRDMAILIYYLKSLSSEPSPGVSDTTITFATVIAGDVTEAEREAVLTPLENFVRGRNSRLDTFRTRARYSPL